ncbi:TetR/AcrR family transcriptional regulator [Nocardioides montaniterrae]
MRKEPRQARSKAMVERIIEAGREVLKSDGYDALTTNRVAQAADVSPGSLYQYFPDKASIMAIVIERYWDEVSERVSASLADRIAELADGPAPGEQLTRAVADALITALEADSELLRVLNEELPISRISARRNALERRVRDLLGAYLVLRPGTSKRPDPGLTSWMIVIAMENLSVRWVLDQPAYDREQVLDEIVALVEGYLSA